MLFGAIDGLGSILSSGIDFISDCIGGLLDGLLNGLKSLGSIFSDGFEFLSDCIIGLLDGIRNILVTVFLPSEGFMDEKISSIRQEFAFADSIIGTVDILLDFFVIHTFDLPPVVDINLGTTEGKYDYGTSALALDMRWYARYKPSVDIILSAFLWVVFVWNTFRDLPNIISGVGSSAVSTEIAMERYEKEVGGGKK